MQKHNLPPPLSAWAFPRPQLLLRHRFEQLVRPTKQRVGRSQAAATQIGGIGCHELPLTMLTDYLAAKIFHTNLQPPTACRAFLNEIGGVRHGETSGHPTIAQFPKYQLCQSCRSCQFQHLLRLRVSTKPGTLRKLRSLPPMPPSLCLGTQKMATPNVHRRRSTFDRRPGPPVAVYTWCRAIYYRFPQGKTYQ
jgi:hypothetical protein